jgi:hypothetical protein
MNKKNNKGLRVGRRYYTNTQLHSVNDQYCKVRKKGIAGRKRIYSYSFDKCVMMSLVAKKIVKPDV